MAKYGDGVNYAKTIDPSSANIIDPGLIGGKVRVMQDYITLTSDLNSTDYVAVGTKLPTGSQVVDIVLTVTGNLTTATSTLVVGDAGSANRYLASNATTMLTSNTVLTGPNVAGGMYHSVVGDTDNYIRVAGANAASVISNGTIKISVMYVVE